MDKAKLESLKKRYEEELKEIQEKLNQTTILLNQLQVAFIDRRSKIEVIEELLKSEEENK